MLLITWILLSSLCFLYLLANLDISVFVFITMATIELRKAARIILVGAPGVGKGTQAERLMKRYPQLSAVSSGDLLRDNVRKKTTLGSWL